jgi:hypothetical protein
VSTTTSREPRPRSALRAFRRLWPIASLAATSALLLAGCGGNGGGPALDRADARQLIALAKQAAAAPGGCAQQRAIARVQAEAVGLVNAHRVPPELQESLMSGVNALVADQPTCLPDVPAASTTPAAPPPAPPAKVRVPVHWPGFGPGRHHDPRPLHGHGHHGPGHDR